MDQIQPGAEQQAQEFARLWQQYIQKGFGTPTTTLKPQPCVLEYAAK